MFETVYAGNADIADWRKFDEHISDSELLLKITAKRGYLLKNNSVPIGVMRFNLFCGTIPFLTLIYIDEAVQGQ